MKMLNKKTLQRINGRRRSVGRAPMVSVLIAVAAALAAGFLVSWILAAVALVAGAAVGFFLYRQRLHEQTIRLEYDPDYKLESRFARIREACEALSASEEIRQENKQNVRQQAEEDPRIEAGLLETPGISTNVEVWGLGLPDRKLLFFPECALLYADDLYQPIPYERLKIEYSPYPMSEEGEVPSDADILGHTWQHLREDGTPDRRYRNNPRRVRVIYGLLEISSAGGFEMRLRVSNRNAAIRFARVLGAESSRGGAKTTTANRSVHQEGIDSRIAYGILGLEPGASREAVIAAYRKLAKVNHPDLMQHLSAREREDAERRMRLLNAAYAELKHQPN